jgi:hypothetical protein
MNTVLKVVLGALGAVVVPASLFAGIYFHAAPASVQSGQSYYIGVTFEPPNDSGSVTLWKDGGTFASNSGWGILAADGWTSDTGPRTAEFTAEGYDWLSGYSEYTYANVSVSGPANQAPVATVEVDGQGHGATITRPYQGAVTITARYKATDADGNLSGIRPQVWSPDGNLNNNGGSFVAQSGSSGEVVWSVTLNQNGNWYFWTDATDTVMAPDFVNSGAWTDAFRLTVNEAPPPPQTPTASVWANTSSLFTSQTAQIYVRGTDVDGDARYFNLDQVSPLNCYYGTGDSFVSSQQPNNSWWDLGTNSGDYTRTVSMSFDKPGTYVWRGAVRDSAGTGGWSYSPSNFTITVPNRDPSVSVQILDAAQNVIGLDGNLRARVYTNTNFYIRVTGADPDGRLLQLYSRVNNAANAPVAYEQVGCSGSNATATFGPYNASTSVGVWDVWAHSQDADCGGYVWQGNGWWGTHSPDVEVVRRPQTISFSNPGAHTHGQQITLAPSATSGLPVTISVVSGPASASTNTITFNGTGTVVLRASQAGNVDYEPASSVEHSVAVNKATPNISGWSNQTRTGTGSFTWNPSLSNPYSGGVAQPTGSITYSVVSATGGGSSPTSGAIVSGSTSFTPGNYAVRASYAGDANHNATTWDTLFTVISLDSDGDGVIDSIELQLGTNPNSASQSDSANTTQLKIHKPQ